MTWICSDCPSEFAFQLFLCAAFLSWGTCAGHQQAPGVQIITRLLNTAYGMVYERKNRCSHITGTKTQEPSIDVFSELCLMWLFLWTLTDEPVHIYSCRETLTLRSCTRALRLCYSQPLMWETNYRLSSEHTEPLQTRTHTHTHTHTTRTHNTQHTLHTHTTHTHTHTHTLHTHTTHTHAHTHTHTHSRTHAHTHTHNTHSCAHTHTHTHTHTTHTHSRTHSRTHTHTHTHTLTLLNPSLTGFY